MKYKQAKEINEAGAYIQIQHDEYNKPPVHIIEEFCALVKQQYNRVFPHSLCSIEQTGLSGSALRHVRFFIASEARENPHMIMMNDMLKCALTVTIVNYTDEQTFLVSVNPDLITITTKPESKYYAQGRVKVAARKFTDTKDKALLKIAKIINDIKAEIHTQYTNNNLMDDAVALLHKKNYVQ